MKTAIARTTNSVFKLKKGQVFKIIGRFFWNGEGHLRLEDSKGNVRTLPDIFFDEVSSK